jgi:CheY-specific phosphatase CheX
VSTGSSEGSAVKVTSPGCTDVAGNVAAGVHSAAFKIDMTAPVISDGGPTPAAPDGLNGWYVSSVSNHFTVADGADGSGVNAACSVAFPADVSTGSSEGSAVKVTSPGCTDVAGNVAAGVHSAAFKIDMTAPTITFASRLPVANGNGWNNSDVTVTWDCADVLSGETTAHSVDTLSSEGANQTAHGACSDLAGNSASATKTGISIDKTAPTISDGGPTPASPNGTNGWYKTSVSNHFTVSDGVGGSGPNAACTSAFPADVSTGVAEGSAVKATSPGCTDVAGNTAAGRDSAAFKIDLTAPSVSNVTVKNADNTTYTVGTWTKQSVTVGWNCSDAGSGVVKVSDSSTISSDTATGSVTPRCDDNAGNATNGTAVSPIKVDKTAPTNVVITGILAKTYAVSDLPASSAISCSADGTISGLAGCIVTGYGADFGVHTLTATATDNAGNQSTTTLTYTVGFQSGNVLPPLTALTGDQGNPLATDLQSFKIKSVLPVKFQMYLDAAKTKLMTTPPVGSYAKIIFVKHDNSVDTNDTSPDLITGSANTGDLYRWTGSPDNQYIYNVSTTGKAAGTYGVSITLYAADGTTLAVSATQYFVLRS